MMLHNGLFWLLVTAHLLGAFYLFPPAADGAGGGRRRLLHYAAYTLLAALSLWPVAFARGPWTAYLLIWLAVAGAYVAIDLAVRAFIAPRTCERAVFFIGHALQLTVIFAVTLVFRVQVGRTLLNPLGSQARNLILDYVLTDSRVLSLLQGLCAFLFIGKPAAKLLHMTLGGVLDPAAKSRAASLYSMLERACVVLLMLSRNYTLIALLFLIKTVAFHGREPKDGQTIERYLLSTLANILLAVLIVLLIGYANPPYLLILPELSGNG